jgi:Region in Clathrin and VPS
MGIFTSLGVALSKYHPDQVMEHLKLFWARSNIPKLIRACEEAHLWPELVFLYCHYDEWDNAALAMMERAADAWEHHSFKDIIVKVANLEIYYRALNFYLQEQPSLLTDLLQALTPRIDVNRVVKMFEKSDNIPLIKPFLLNVQSQNKKIVNSAINDLLIEEEDYKTLRDSVENYDNYEPVELAQRLERHDLVFFRQIAANIYRKNKRWEKSIALSKQDKLFKDAIETAAISGKSEVVEELLRYVSFEHANSIVHTNKSIVRRHWKPRVLCWHVVRLLRPNPRSCCYGDFLASRPYRLHHAIHDQLPRPAKLYDRDVEEGQRGAQIAGEVAGEGGEQHSHPWWQPIDDYRWPSRRTSIACSFCSD